MDTLHSLPGPDDIHREILPNGITILTRSNFNSPSVVVSGYFGAGDLSDPDDKLGLAEYTSYSLMRGTKTRSFDRIYNELESVGASLGFSSGVHTSGFNGRSLAEDLPLLLRLLSDALTAPAFPKTEMEKLRAQDQSDSICRGKTDSILWNLPWDAMCGDRNRKALCRSEGSPQH